jgi:hypothetical protein
MDLDELVSAGTFESYFEIKEGTSKDLLSKDYQSIVVDLSQKMSESLFGEAIQAWVIEHIIAETLASVDAALQDKDDDTTEDHAEDYEDDSEEEDDLEEVDVIMKRVGGIDE